MTQTHFAFEPIQENLERYFILHSGVSEELRRAEFLLNQRDLIGGAVIYVCGPKGCGKSHFIKVILEKSAKIGVLSKYFIFNKKNEIIDTLGNIIDTTSVVSSYQDIKSDGGLLVFEAENLPASVTSDPHLLSRLNSGEIFSLNYPMEEELRPVLLSLLERHHLRLKENHVSQILRQVPAIPEYFEMVSRELTDLLLVAGRIKNSSIREVVEARI